MATEPPLFAAMTRPACSSRCLEDDYTHQTTGQPTRRLDLLYSLPEPSKTFVNLLVSNVHDRALSVLINNIEPATHARGFEKVVMRIIGKHVPRAKSIANQWSGIV